ncbi:hypothetical protein CPC16_010039 [Podila verticillata]|nr:hypothetical protein CPC16_010039 [Podila verticillata]
MEHVHRKADATDMVLKTFTLNIMALSEPDPALVQKIMSLCILEELRIECPPFDPRLSASTAQVLASVRWTILEHLKLIGDNISEWIQLLPNIKTPRLQSLSIQGSERVEQTLDHSCVLFLEQCIRVSPLMELRFSHIQLQDRLDWARLFQSMDPSLVGRGLEWKEEVASSLEAVQLEL